MCWPLVNVFEYISSIVKYNTLNKWKVVKSCFVYSNFKMFIDKIGDILNF